MKPKNPVERTSIRRTSRSHAFPGMKSSSWGASLRNPIPLVLQSPILWNLTRRISSRRTLWSLTSGACGTSKESRTCGASNESRRVETNRPVLMKSYRIEWDWLLSSPPAVLRSWEGLLCCFIGICFPMLHRRLTPELILRSAFSVSKQGWKTDFSSFLTNLF